MAGVRLPRLIGIVGAGQLGSGIAQVCATKGQDVILCDTSMDALDASMAGIRRRLDSLIRKDRLTSSEADMAFNRLQPTVMMEVCPQLTTFSASRLFCCKCVSNWYV